MLNMKQTIGRYINIEIEEYPISLYFNDFYYYERADGKHLLLHTLTGKRFTDFYLNNNSNLFRLINERFGLDIDLISISHNNESYYSATKFSEFFRGRDYNCSGVTVGNIHITYLLDDMGVSEEKKEVVNKYIFSLTGSTVLDTLDISVNIKPNDINVYPRPPTE